MLPNGKQSGIAGEQIPHAGQRQIDQESVMRRILAGEVHHGANVSRPTTSTAAIVAMRLARVERTIGGCRINRSSETSRAGEQPG